jgi:hypothetical protein
VKLALSALLGIAVLALASGVQAQITFSTPSIATTSDGSVDATALFVEGSGKLTITLTDLQTGEHADGQLISGISFNVNSATGSGKINTVNQGNISSINSDGTYTAGVSDPLTRWKASESGKTIDLTALSGGKPNRLIIGPDSKGGFSHGGTYNVNPSVTNHQPVVLGSATFTLTVPGITSLSTISNVMFQFGTTPDSIAGVVVPSTVTAVPEPGPMAILAALGLIGASMALSRRQRK